MTDQDFRKKVKLISLMGSAFHKYGTNAERLESTLNHLTLAMGLKGNFFSTPTYLIISINDGDDQITRHIRALPSDANLERLQDLDTLAGKVYNNQISDDDAIVALAELDNRKPSYNNYAVFFAFCFTSMSLSIIFGGEIKDALISFVIGGIVGLLSVIKIKVDKISESFEFLASFFVSFLSCIMFHFVTPFHFQNVIISSLIVIIPGIGVTIALNELASQNLASGTARLMGSLVGLLKISFGIFLAAQTNKILFPEIISPVVIQTPAWYIIPAMIITSLTLTIIFSAKKSDYIWVLISGFLTYGCLKFANIYFSDVFSLFIAAFTIGVFSNLVAKIRDKSSLTTLLPGIIFLVPGNVGIKGLNLLFENNVIAGIDTSMKMFILSITIVTGLLIANMFLSPRKGL
jgi:uncharacterized membrane protein YjjP (DUF1212 family)